jgi:hypothetical protein
VIAGEQALTRVQCCEPCARTSLRAPPPRYRDELFIGSYADPRALPEVERLPELLAAEVDALAGRGADLIPG